MKDRQKSTKDGLRIFSGSGLIPPGMAAPGKDLDDLIGSLYDCALDPAQWQEALSLFASAFDGSDGHFCIWDAETDSPVFSVFSPLPEQAEGSNSLGSQGPDLPDSLQSADWQAYRQICKDTSTSGYDLFHVALLASTSRHFIASRLPGLQRQSTFIAFSRPSAAEPLSDEQQRRLEQTTPHLQRAAALHRNLAQIATQNALFSVILDSLPDAIAITTVGGILVYSNAAANAHFYAASTPVTVKDGLLTSTDPNALGLLRTRLSDASRLGLGSAIRLTSYGSPPRLTHLTLFPLAFKNEGEQQKGEHHVLVLMSNPLKPALPSLPALQLLFGFTATEARLALAVAEGKTLEQYAEKASVAVSTARYQLHNVLSKSGASRQAELVSQILSIRVGRQ